MGPEALERLEGLGAAGWARTEVERRIWKTQDGNAKKSRFAPIRAVESVAH